MTAPFASSPNHYQQSHESSTYMEGPPEESFDEKYNKRLEFPLSLVSAILFHVVIGAVLLVLLVYAIGFESDSSDVKMSLVNLEGFDDKGSGSTGFGGKEVADSFFKNEGFTEIGPDPLVDPNPLPAIKQAEQPKINPENNKPNSTPDSEAFDKLSKSIREKLAGAKQGAGAGPGSGNDDKEGKGPGGDGADSTMARNLRWVLRFKVESGREYVEQLKAMGAEVIFPIPDSKKIILIADLNKLDDQKIPSDDDLKRLAKKVKFSDVRKEAVNAVAQRLGIDFSPKSFWAYFPKDLEDELSKKEVSYRNRRVEDIEETIFSVAVKDGKYELKVVEQKVKK